MKNLFSITIYLLAALTGCAQSEDAPCSTAVQCIKISAAKKCCDLDKSGGLTPNECHVLRMDTLAYNIMDNCTAAQFVARWESSEYNLLHSLVDTSALVRYYTFPARMKCWEVEN